MEEKDKHYFSKYPDSKLEVHTVSESLRRHLFIFKTLTGVFSYSKLDLGTHVLIQYMTIPRSPGIFLDLGCGYGPIGIVAAYESPQSEVYMVDVNTRAVWCSKENVKLNLHDDLKRIHVLNGNFFDAIKDPNLNFDAVYMNPPVRQGRQVFLDLIDQIFTRLTPDGFFEFVLRKKMGARFMYDHLIESYPQHEIGIITKKSGYWVFHCSHS